MSTNNNRNGKEIRPEWKDAAKAIRKVSFERLTALIENNNDISEITALSLEGRKVEKIENLRGFVSLQRLNLSNNELNRLNGMNDVTRLGLLNISHNDLKGSASLEELRYLTGLRTLNISHNVNIIHIQPHVVKGLISLRAFIANECGLDNISFLRNLPLLTTLTLSRNNISQIIPSDISSLSNLIKLSIGYNKLTTFPNLTSCIQLHELRINHNSISVIPIIILNNKRLKTFDISHNKLNSWDTVNTLTQLPELTNLSLVQNEFPRPPVELSDIQLREDISSEGVTDTSEYVHYRRYVLFLFQKLVGKLQKPKIQLIVLDSKRVKSKWSHHDKDRDQDMVTSDIGLLSTTSQQDDTDGNDDNDDVVESNIGETSDILISRKERKKRAREQLSSSAVDNHQNFRNESDMPVSSKEPLSESKGRAKSDANRMTVKSNKKSSVTMPSSTLSSSTLYTPPSFPAPGGSVKEVGKPQAKTTGRTAVTEEEEEPTKPMSRKQRKKLKMDVSAVVPASGDGGAYGYRVSSMSGHRMGEGEGGGGVAKSRDDYDDDDDDGYGYGAPGPASAAEAPRLDVSLPTDLRDVLFGRSKEDVLHIGTGGHSSW